MSAGGSISASPPESQLPKAETILERVKKFMHSTGLGSAELFAGRVRIFSEKEAYDNVSELERQIEACLKAGHQPNARFTLSNSTRKQSYAVGDSQTCVDHPHTIVDDPIQEASIIRKHLMSFALNNDLPYPSFPDLQHPVPKGCVPTLLGMNAPDFIRIEMQPEIMCSNQWWDKFAQAAERIEHKIEEQKTRAARGGALML